MRDSFFIPSRLFVIIQPRRHCPEGAISTRRKGTLSIHPHVKDSPLRIRYAGNDIRPFVTKFAP